ncbi:MAG: hypothetical protein J1E62_02515 [Lachnospiraceae bacterium]|nr:hypothetical protein [Lachnospiraceae bacterium]
MYIEEKYWNDYIGGTDDSLTLVEYLAGKQKKEISLGEIFADTGLDKLDGDFRTTDSGLEYTDKNGMEFDFYYAIDLITDLAALILECRVNGSVNLCELFGDDLETDTPNVCITATPEEHELINETLKDFVSSPLEYDLSEMCDEEDMREMAEICESLRKELYEE